MSPLQQKALRSVFGELQKVKAGDPIPSERDLAEIADVTRTVIRGLLTSLTKRGLIRREGRNWVLSTAIKPSILKLVSENPVSRPQEVKDHLLEELASGRLQPGQRITELALAKKLGVATISVREALLEMTPLGVFSKNKSRRWVVASLTPAKVATMREFRQMVEMFCLRKLMASGLPPASRQDLEAIRTETQSFVTGNSQRPRKMLEVDLRFHRLLLEASGNSLVVERAEFIYLIIGFQLTSPFFSTERGLLGLRQHLTIIDAILEGKASAAEASLLSHLQAAEETLCTILEKTSDTPVAPRAAKKKM